jgi:hypothetical protein
VDKIQFNGRKVLDLTGMKSGMLTATRPVGNQKKRGVVWECVCDCGDTTSLIASKILRGETKSCGCQRSGGRDRGYKQRRDRARSRQVFGEIPLWYFHSIEGYARKRGLEFAVSIQLLDELFKKQNGVCAITNLEIHFAFGQNKAQTTASLDRIDSSLGYVHGNLQWVHKNINLLKSNKSNESFVAWCLENYGLIKAVVDAKSAS